MTTWIARQNEPIYKTDHYNPEKGLTDGVQVSMNGDWGTGDYPAIHVYVLRNVDQVFKLAISADEAVINSLKLINVSPAYQGKIGFIKDEEYADERQALTEGTVVQSLTGLNEPVSNFRNYITWLVFRNETGEIHNDFRAQVDINNGEAAVDIEFTTFSFHAEHDIIPPS